MEIGEVRRVSLPGFAVIGKEGKGLSQEGASWVPPLWEKFTKHSTEIVELAAEGSEEVHLWGLMSDEKTWLEPWGEVGRYLAGVEVPKDTKAPEDWRRWEMPAMDYLVVKTNSENLDMMTEEMLSQILPNENAVLAAAIQEHYLPEFEKGEVELYFPVTYDFSSITE